MPNLPISRWPLSVGRGTLGLLLPGSCCLCHGEVVHYRQPNVLCTSCQRTLSAKKKCPRCSAVLEHENALPTENCPWCHHLKLPFEEITAVGNYEGALKDAILAAKSNRGTAIAWDLGQLLSCRSEEIPPEAKPLIVPVPMHWTRRIRRGTNTAAILAKSMAHKTGWSHQSLVACRRRLAKQSELPFSARRNNVRKAFAIRGSVPTDRPIVLVDDIMTTGSTLTELAGTLRKAGATEIRVAIVARSTPEYVNV